MIINNRPVEKVKSYIYLGQKIEITRNNLYPWHGQHLGECKIKSDIPNTIKARVFNQYVLPVLTYGTETRQKYYKQNTSNTGSHKKINSKHQPTRPHYQHRNKKKNKS